MVKVKAKVNSPQADKSKKVKVKRQNFLLFFYIFVVLTGSVSLASELYTPPLHLSDAVQTASTGQLVKSEIKAPKGTESVWDPAKYISLDEVKAGMKAYCLTEYGAAGIEKFGVEVVDVVRNIEPGRNAILVKGTDERFMHTGPVAGCSGSPVYIEGRLAGALSFAFDFSKDPLYGVTPIEEMLTVGKGPSLLSSQFSPRGEVGTRGIGFGFDFSKPIDFDEIDRQITTPAFARNNKVAGAAVLPCPLITSGLPVQVCEQLNSFVEPIGLMVVWGAGGGVKGTDLSGWNRQSGGEGEPAGTSLADLSSAEGKGVKLVPGACLAIPLVSGDITMTVFGTVTEVVGDKVYGFGHSFSLPGLGLGLGYGPVDLPMATGQVHTVVSSLRRSFKLASVGEIVGALTISEETAVFGQLGARAKLIPLTVRVERYNDAEKRVYNCRVANNRLLAPLLLRAATAGATLYLGDLPPDHTIEYKVAIKVEGAESITFENVSTDSGLAEMLMESIGPVALLMNNPYKEVSINSIDYDVRIVPKNIISHIWSVDLSDSEVKAGEEIEVGVVVESVLAGKKKYQFRLKIPKDLPPGKYELSVCGAQDYEQFLKKVVPYRFTAQSLPGLIEAINNSLRIDRARLSCVLALPPGGVTVEEAEMPDLPATKALVLQNAKRALKTQPYQHWLENSLETGTIVIDKKVLQITVEE
jgi:hypothetical protein